jgi:hypothetical protein
MQKVWEQLAYRPKLCKDMSHFAPKEYKCFWSNNDLRIVANVIEQTKVRGDRSLSSFLLHLKVLSRSLAD